MSAVYTPPFDKSQRHIHTASQQMPAAHAPLFDKCQRYIHRYSTKFSSILTAIRQMSAVYPPLFDKVDVHSYIYIQRVLAYTFSRHVSPTNLRFSFGSCRFRCIIFVLLLTCLAAFALTLLVCLFACRRKRNDRTRRGPMQRGATLPLPSRWPSTKGCSNTCGQPHWAPPRARVCDEPDSQLCFGVHQCDWLPNRD